ncbi:hypothetical protein AB1339_34110 [Streptomyces cyaneofuscatus]|uniref:hypothetical protein n=1 Tax=Streptomyces cyaneofuscatus TaxID=66883 RepID=UPI00345D020C
MGEQVRRRGGAEPGHGRAGRPGRRAKALAGALPAAMLLASCVLGDAPPEKFSGFRMEGTALLAAMPLCPDETITGAAIVVPRKDETVDDFETLWSAREPSTAEARSGVFHVNSPSTFTTVTKPLSGTLPNTFYVQLQHLRAGEEATKSGYVDLGELRSAELADGEFLTYRGAVMTRAEINAQLPCNKRK